MVSGKITSAESIILIDTNILIIYAREGDAAKRLESILGLQEGRVEALVSIVTIGESLSLARKLGWAKKRQTALNDLITSRLIPIDINRPEILDAYAEIDYYCEKTKKPARKIGQNDLWIASTAHVIGCPLATTDKDFNHLHDRFISLRFVDPASLRS